MEFTYPQFVASGSSDRIVESLTQRQHVRPHQPVTEAVAIAGMDVGFGGEVARQAVELLGMSQTRLIGRLRRTELIQLAKVIHRCWRQSVAAPTQASQAI